MAHTPPGKTREKVYRFVRQRIMNGQPPTIREVQEGLGFRAYESARRHLDNLVAAGRLLKDPGKSRGYTIPTGAPLVLVPLVGQVQAGDLTTAVQEAEGAIPFHTRTPAEDLFALRVRGESMTGVGIMPGDIALVRRQPVAENGDIVVALVDDEATVKRLRRRGGRIELLPENPAFSPIVPDPAAVTILGKVVEIRRYLEGESWVEVPS